MTTIQERERDELARDIFTADNSRYTKEQAHAEWAEWILGGVDPKQNYCFNTADGLIAQGYRKPRMVTSLEDLEALPFEAVIRDAEGHVLERWGDAEHVMWSTPGCKWFVPVTEIALPVTVLYEVRR